MGINLNFMSTMALSLVAGVLVDDAIVEIENIVRHMRMGKSAYQASIDAADEIGLAVLATTMAIVAVFLPVALMPGISGQFFKSFGYTVVITVMMSLLVARMITPLMAAYFLRAQGRPAARAPAGRCSNISTSSSGASTAPRRPPSVPRCREVPTRFVLLASGVLIVVLLIAVVRRRRIRVIKALAGLGLPVITASGRVVAGTVVAFGVGKLIGRHAPAHAAAIFEMMVGRLSAWMHDHRIVMVGAGSGTLIMTGVLFANLGMQFQPPLNLDFSRVRIGMPPGATLEQTEAKVPSRRRRSSRRIPTSTTCSSACSSAPAFSTSSSKKDREKTSTEFERGLTPQLSAIPDAQVSFLSQGGGGPGGGRATSCSTSAATIPSCCSPDREQDLRRDGDPARACGAARPGRPRPARNHDQAALRPRRRPGRHDHGAEPDDPHRDAWRHRAEQRQILARRPAGADHRVAVGERRRDLTTLENLPVPTTSGGSVPLKAVAEIGFGSGPTTVQRTNQIRRILVGADLAPGLVASDAWKKIDNLPTLKNLPQGVGKLNLGDQKWQAELIYYFLIALGSGVLLVFAVLVLLYRRFLAPFVNMGSLLLAPLGAAVGLFVAGQPLSSP